TTKAALCTSPSTRPSTCMSPVEESVPVTTTSALMMEGAGRAPVRFCCACACGSAAGETGGVAAAEAVVGSGVASLVLVNMAACLYESARISHHVSQPHFVVDMGTGAAAGGSEFSHRRAFFDLSAYPHQNRRQM